MKTLRLISKSLIFAFVASSIVACGSDDDDVTSGVKFNTNNKRIARIVWYNDYESSENIYSEYEYKYDSQGRVVRVRRSDKYSYSTMSYSYSEQTITCTETPKTGSETRHVYTLKDGRIIKDVRSGNYNSTITYTYNSDGYPVDRTDSGGYGSENYVYNWENGNLVSLDEFGGYKKEWKYSNIPWPKNYFQYMDGASMDDVLQLVGAWGKVPKNLPYEITKYSETTTFDYTIEDGLITKIVYTPDGLDDFHRVSIGVITWEDGVVYNAK